MDRRNALAVAAVIIAVASVAGVLLVLSPAAAQSGYTYSGTSSETPTATLDYATPTRVYTESYEPQEPESPPRFDWMSIPMPQYQSAGGGVGEAEMHCPSFPTFTMGAIEMPPPITFPPLSTLVVSPNVPPVLTFTIETYTMADPDFPTIPLPVPALPLTATGFDIETSTITVSLPFSLVFNITAVTQTWQPVITRSYRFYEDMEDDVWGGGFGVQSVQGGLSVQAAEELASMELFGYTASEMATELTDGMMTTFDYVRAIADIGILGPTAASILIGLGWITIISFAKILFKAVQVIIDVTRELLRIVIDVVKMILEIIHLIPFL